MKLSFSIPSSKSSSKHNSAKQPSHTFNEDSSSKHDSNSTSKHLITEFDVPFKTPIPPIKNQWPPITDSITLTFQHDTSSSAAGRPDMSHGLNLRRTSDKNQQPDANGGGDKDNAAAAPWHCIPLEATMLQKLKDDLKILPEHQGFDDFNDVPVEGFGAAILAGYGYSDVKVVEYTPYSFLCRLLVIFVIMFTLCFLYQNKYIR